MHSKAKMESLQAIIDMMDKLMLGKAKERRKPAVAELTIATEPGAAEHEHAPEDDLGDEDARSLADLYARPDDEK